MDIDVQPERPVQINPTTRIEIVLEAQTWNAVLTAISKAPLSYEFTAPLMNAIQQQCMAKAEVV
jgi:hypothetical protein